MIDKAGPDTCRPVPAALVGASRPSQLLRRAVERAAACDAKVLITGETGVGKSLVAACIHALSRRAGRPLVTIQCAGLSDTLLESELFGHVKGSFTGAVRDRPGKLSMADSGTVVFDDIAETTPRMQAVLLRFLESGEVQRIGDLYRPAVVDVRVFAETSRNIEALVASGKFREDLYYRVNVMHIDVPPLRDRLDDIPLLVDHFAARLDAGPLNGPAISPASMQALQAHNWPGNIRELENLVKRLVVNGPNEIASLTARKQRPPIAAVPARERRRTVADDLFQQLIERRGTFWTLVYPRFMGRDMTRDDLRALVRKGLQATCGSYKSTARLFQVGDAEYKKFLDVLRFHGCRLQYRDFR